MEGVLPPGSASTVTAPGATPHVGTLAPHFRQCSATSKGRETTESLRDVLIPPFEGSTNAERRRKRVEEGVLRAGLPISQGKVTFQDTDDFGESDVGVGLAEERAHTGSRRQSCGTISGTQRRAQSGLSPKRRGRASSSCETSSHRGRADVEYIEADDEEDWTDRGQVMNGGGFHANAMLQGVLAIAGDTGGAEALGQV